MSAIKKIRFWTWTCHLSIIIETNLFCLAAKCMQLFFFMSSAADSTQRIILQIFCSKFLKIPLVSPNLQVILLVKILLFLQHQNLSRLKIFCQMFQYTKGQLISKGFFGFFKKTNEKFLPQYARAKINIFKFVFWEN